MLEEDFTSNLNIFNLIAYLNLVKKFIEKQAYVNFLQFFLFQLN